MLGACINFSKSDLAYFSAIIKKAKILMAGANIYLPKENNNSLNYSCETTLHILSESLQYFMCLSPTNIEEAQLLGKRNAPFSQVCDSILGTLYILKKEDHLHFHEVVGYFCLLGNITEINMLCGMEAKPTQDYGIIVNSIERRADILESNHLTYISDPNFHHLRQRSASNLLLQKIFYSLNESIDIPLPILRSNMDCKNEHARKANAPYHCEIVYYPLSCFRSAADPEAIQLVVNKISLLAEGTHSARQQLLVYYNHSHGLVTSMEVYFDASEKKIFILDVNSGSHSSQYFFLFKLNSALKQQGFPFQIFACQANVQKEKKCPDTALYSYAFSHITSSLSFSQFQTCSTSQPLFIDFLHIIDGRSFPPLENVQWVTLNALGNKATRINQWIQDFGKWLAKCSQQDPCLPFPLFDKELKAIYKKLKTKNPAQAIRRAAAGNCSTDELRKLLDASPSEINTADEVPNKKYTPLHLAFQHDQPEQAILLIERKARWDIPDAKQKTPHYYFLAAKPDSRIKQNTALLKWGMS